MGEDTSFIPGLFNTQLADTISPLLMAAVSSQRRNIQGGDLKYGEFDPATGTMKTPLKPSELPRQLDTRFVDGFPENEVKKWFYQDYKGKLETILTDPLDQAGCGSCWAFSTASQFDDVIRFNLLRLYGTTACMKSVFFHPAIVCTGETNVASSKGVVNAAQVRVYAEEKNFGISEYFTVAFSPKVSPSGTSLDLKCNAVLDEWKKSITTLGHKPEILSKVLSSSYTSCMGCQGNLIVCPLMLFTAAVEEATGVAEGAPLITDFPLHEWACLWGNMALREKFCSPKFLEGTLVFKFPKLYKADYYSYVTGKDAIPPSIKSQGINSIADWMMMSIYYYGPITIGFSVYQSFLDFFKTPANGKKIYTGAQFMQDINSGKSKRTPLGGHAVVVVGWGEETVGTTTTPYWVVRNSWGIKWADEGYFRIERGIDAKLPSGAPKIKFEYEFGSLYFAPNPNPTLDVNDEGKPVVNDMKDYLMPVPSFRCPAFEEHPDMLAQMNKHCSCRCGSHFDFASNSCVKAEKYIPPEDIKALQYSASLADIETEDIAEASPEEIPIELTPPTPSAPSSSSPPSSSTTPLSGMPSTTLFPSPTTLFSSSAASFPSSTNTSEDKNSISASCKFNVAGIVTIFLLVFFLLAIVVLVLKFAFRRTNKAKIGFVENNRPNRFYYNCL